VSQIVVDWDEVVAGQYVYDPTGVPWRVASRWSDGTVVLVNAQYVEHRMPRPRGPVTVEGVATMEEGVAIFQQILGAKVVGVAQ